MYQQNAKFFALLVKYFVLLLAYWRNLLYVCNVLTMITGGKYSENARYGIIKTVKHESN